MMRSVPQRAVTGSVPGRGRRHPVSVVTEARRLREGGWAPAEIQRLLEGGGVKVSLGTICRWVDEDAERKWRMRSVESAARRAAKRGAGGIGVRPNTRPEFRAGRRWALGNLGLSAEHVEAVMRLDFGEEVVGFAPGVFVPDFTDGELLSLRGDGLSFAAIAKVAGRFYGVELTENQVRYRLVRLGARKNPNKVRVALARRELRVAA